MGLKIVYFMNYQYAAKAKLDVPGLMFLDDLAVLAGKAASPAAHASLPGFLFLALTFAAKLTELGLAYFFK